jgi:glycosyltransferase involved in cell wall biosynthesis
MINPHTEIGDVALLPGSPRVSIIVLTYNHAPFLEEAVDSLAAQRTAFPYEIIVAEDASTDGTREVAVRLQRKYPHLVRLIYSEANRGMIGNFRLAVSLCRGEYIAGCEGDDFWVDPDKLQRQIDALDRLPDVDMAFTRGYELYADGTRVPGWDYGPASRLITAKEMFQGLGFIVPAASSVMRANILKELPQWVHEAPTGDSFHYLAGSARGGAWYDPHLTICYRRAHATSFSVAHDKRTDEEMIVFLKSFLDYFSRARRHYRVPRSVVAERLNDYQLQIAKRRIKQGKAGAGLRELARVDASFLLRGAGRRLGKALGLDKRRKRAR